jgi:hypothetical protein
MKQLLVLLGLLVAFSATAQTVTITDNTTGGDYTGTEDARIAEDAPDFTIGGDDKIVLKRNVTPNRQRGLIRFTGLSNIEGPVTVTSVTLRLWQQSGGATTFDVSLHKVLRDWTELLCSWNEYQWDNGLAWATPGAMGTGDSVATASATVSVNSTTGEYKDFSSSQMAADVQDWINNGGNHGWLLKPDAEDSAGTEKEFVTHEGTDGQRPILVVTYTTGGGEEVGQVITLQDPMKTVGPHKSQQLGGMLD